MQIDKIKYNNLSARKKEIFNFQKLASIFADYDFNCIKLSDDWEGADFLAYQDLITLKVQLKSSIMISKKYLDKDLYIAFRIDDRDINSDWCLIKHDILVKIIKEKLNWLNTSSWIEKGIYRAGQVPKGILLELEKYIINNKGYLNL